MKTTIIIIGVVLGTILVAGVLLAFIAPRNISVTHTQFIKASKQEVFDNLRFMGNFTKWSPFLIQDPQQKNYVTGADGQVGATFHWEGVGEKSKGFQTVASLKGNDEILLSCTITEPFTANPTFAYTLTEQQGGVLLTQQFDNELPPPANIFGMLMGLKEKISATNKIGLDRLKQVAEKNLTVEQ